MNTCGFINSIACTVQGASAVAFNSSLPAHAGTSVASESSSALLTQIPYLTGGASSPSWTGSIGGVGDSHAAIATIDPAHVWECSHIGGCRFAPALVLLPHGYVLGGLTAADAPAIVRDYAEGRLDPLWVRGRSSLPPAVQAAQHHARAATGALGVDALRLVDVVAEPQADGSPGWRVELADPDCSVRLRERRVETGRPLTCAATTPGYMRVFELVEVTPAATAHPAARDMDT